MAVVKAEHAFIAVCLAIASADWVIHSVALDVVAPVSWAVPTRSQPVVSITVLVTFSGTGSCYASCHMGPSVYAVLFIHFTLVLVPSAIVPTYLYIIIVAVDVTSR